MSSTLERQLATYADQLESLTEPVSEAEIISRTRPATLRNRRGLIAVAAAAAVLALVGIAAIVAQVTGQEEAPLAPIVPGPEAVFSWSEHDLSEWVTEDEMTAVLEDLLGEEIEGRALLDPEADDSVWTFGGWRVIAHNGDHRPEGGIVNPTRTDPRLPEGVTYEALSGFAHGFYGLAGPHSDESICLTVSPPDSYFGYLEPASRGDPEGSSEVEVHEDRVFAVASMMLQEMRWVDREDPKDDMSDPEAVFSWGEDIFEWVTTDEMKAMFESLSMRYAGAPLSEGELVRELDPSGDPWDGASWSHNPSAPSQVPWRPPPGQWSVSAQMWEWKEFVTAPQTDPRLPDGVVFWPGPWGFGYTLRGPNSSEAIGIGLLPPLESDLRPFDTYPDRRETYDDMFFEVASMMLRELGWAD